MHTHHVKIPHTQLMHLVNILKMQLKYYQTCSQIQFIQKAMLKGKDTLYIENYLKPEKCNLKHSSKYHIEE